MIFDMSTNYNGDNNSQTKSEELLKEERRLQKLKTENQELERKNAEVRRTLQQQEKEMNDKLKYERIKEDWKQERQDKEWERKQNQRHDEAQYKVEAERIRARSQEATEQTRADNAKDFMVEQANIEMQKEHLIQPYKEMENDRGIYKNHCSTKDEIAKIFVQAIANEWEKRKLLQEQERINNKNITEEKVKKWIEQFDDKKDE